MIKISAINQNNKQPLLNLLKQDFKGIDLEKTADEIENLTDSEQLFVCLTEDDKAIGFAKSTFKGPSILKLDYIYITPKLRRDKNGSVLLVSVYNYAVNHLIAGLIGECKSDNECAIAFFKARGFICTVLEDGSCSLTKSLLHMYKTEHK